MRGLVTVLVLIACDPTQSAAVQPLDVATPCWPGQASENLPAGTLVDYEPLNWSTCESYEFRGADNEGTRISGLSTNGITPGTVRVLFNWTTSGLDSGMVAFLNAGNVRTPNGETCYVSYYSGAAIQLAPDYTWRFMWGCHSWQMRVKTQALNLYPACVVSIAAGTHHDWNPTCESTYALGGLAGGSRDFRDYSLVVVNVPIEGARITGIGSITGGNGDPADVGQTKWLLINGPGELELAVEAGSHPAKAFALPNNESITLRQYEGAILASPGSDTSIDRRWHVFARGNTYDKLRVVEALEAGEVATDAQRFPGSVTPAPMPTGVIDVWAPVDAVTGKSFHTAHRLRVQGSFGTILCGLEPGVTGESHLLTNYAAAFVARSDCPGTPAAARLIIADPEIIVRPRGHFRVVYDGAWLVERP